MNYVLTLLDGASQGIIWALLALGVFLSFRVLDFADLTVEGSITTGAATTCILITNGVNPYLATLVAIFAGGCAGLITALLHTKLKIPPILAGILTMIGLYSINIAIMGGRANLSLLGKDTVFTQLRGAFLLDAEFNRYFILVMAVIAIVVTIAALYWYFGTESGSAVRATGDNEKMCRAQGIHTDNTKILGLVISNALVGFAGSFIAQQQSFADVNMGVGAIVIGLASVIIGETVFGKRRGFLPKLIAVVVGSVIYRIIITVCIMTNILDSSYLKLLTAVIVAIALSIPTIKRVCHSLSVKMCERYPWYAQHIRLKGERKVRREAVNAERAAAHEEKMLIISKRKQEKKEEKARLWKEANPDAWAKRQEETARKEQAHLAALQIKNERKAQAAAAADARHAAHKERMLADSNARLSALEADVARYETILSEQKATLEEARAILTASPEDAAAKTRAEAAERSVRKTIARVECGKKLVEEQTQSVSILTQSEGGENTINLKIVNLSKTFNRGTINEKRALSDVSIDIKKGDFITVIGGNGAGKSTLLNLTSGVYEADSGRLFIDGVNVTHMPEYKRARYLGRVFQDPMMGTAANMEIDENLALANRRGQLKGLGWSVTKEERVEFAKRLETLGLGLETRLTSKVGLLSGGQRQALTLLMATLQEPKLLLLDEHTAALDPKTAKAVLDLTEKITTETNLTTMMITHNMNDALRMGNRLIMMHEGRIIFDVEGEDKKKLTVDDLLKKFESTTGEALASDKMLLAD